VTLLVTGQEQKPAGRSVPPAMWPLIRERGSER